MTDRDFAAEMAAIWDNDLPPKIVAKSPDLYRSLKELVQVMSSDARYDEYTPLMTARHLLADIDRQEI